MLLVVAIIFAATGAAGWVLTRQLVDLATKLPDYKENIQTKLRSIKVPTGGVFTKLSETVEELKKDLPGAETPAQTVIPVAGTPRPRHCLQTRARCRVGASGGDFQGESLELVQICSRPYSVHSGLQRCAAAGYFYAPSAGRFAQPADPAHRQRAHQPATQAMDDAGARVFRYLLMQLVVNVTTASPWRLAFTSSACPMLCCGAPVRRCSDSFPILDRGSRRDTGRALAGRLAELDDAVTDDRPFCPARTSEQQCHGALALGSSTGVTPIALIIAAVFWTWLWGPVGLILSTPLTVCLVVMGRHVPRLSFLSVLLSDEEALTPAEDFYHRLLTADEQDELEFVEAYLKANSLAALYDSVFVPVIIATERDHRLELLDDEQRLVVEQSLRDIIEDLGTVPQVASKIDANGAESQERHRAMGRCRFAFCVCQHGRIATNSRARCSRSYCSSKPSRRRTPLESSPRASCSIL